MDSRRAKGKQPQHQPLSYLRPVPIAPVTHSIVGSSGIQAISRKRAASALQPPPVANTGGSDVKKRRVQNGGKSNTRKSANDGKEDDTKFWKKLGMNTFLDWLLNPANLKRFDTTGTTAGKLVKDLREEIAAHINTKSEDRFKEGWKPWTAENVKYNKTASETRYRRARDLTETTGAGDDETTTLDDRIRRICPQFTRFHGAYLGSVRVNPPPMVQTTTIPGEPDPVFEFSDESGDDSDRVESDESSVDQDDENQEIEDDDEGHEHVIVDGFDMAELLANHSADGILISTYLGLCLT